MPEITPAEIINDPGDSISSEAMLPVINGWRAASHVHTTFVYAGAVAHEQSTGLLAINRMNIVTRKTGGGSIEIPGSGPVRIVDAPLGRKVVRSALVNGELRFTSVNGISGTLHLADEAVTLDSGEVLR